MRGFEMPISARYVIVCDDVRREDNGKLIILGMYLPDMTVQQIPFPMPTLTFLVNAESDRPGNYPFQFKVEHQESGTVLAQGMGIIPVANPQLPILIPVKLAGIVFRAPGLYSFSMTIDGQRDPIAATFNVQLVQNVFNPQIPGMAR
jgi:hypothetical protein